MKLNISHDGRIVVVDDKWKESAPLVNGFASYGIPCLYYNGRMDTLPQEPLVGIRFLFLDIDLMEWPASTKIQEKCAFHEAYFSRLISKANGPLIVVFWTSHEKDAESIATALKNEGWKFLDMNLDKGEFISEEGDYDLSKLMGEIEARIATGPMFIPFIAWENAVHYAVSSISHDFSELFSSEVPWTKGLSLVMGKLEEEFSGIDKSQDKNERFRRSCYVLNECLLHAIQSEGQKVVVPDGFKFCQHCDGVDQLRLVARINSFLAFEEGNDFEDLCGTVHECSSISLRKSKIRLALIKKIFGKDLLGSQASNEDKAFGECCKLCQIVITPQCDISQGHRIKFSGACGNVTLHQTVFAIMFPYEELKERNVKSSHSLMKLHPFYCAGEIVQVVVAFTTVDLTPICKGRWKFCGRFKRGVLNDIQAHAASYLNRIGNSLLTPN